MESDDRPATVAVTRVRLADAQRTTAPDELVAEEPLEIRVGGVSIAVVMRTPGHDFELSRGFAITERIVASASDITAIRHCTQVPDPDAEDNVVQLILREGLTVDLARFRRNLYASSSCGICGKATIDAAMRTAPALAPDAFVVEPETLYAMPDQLRRAQAVFERTGGLHAAGLFDAAGHLQAVREDIGRHNAVDKVIGWAAGDPSCDPTRCTLMVSGRVSYEIVQKALAARIPVVAAVSAPSSLACDLAERAGMTLVAFLRGASASVYCGAQRIADTSGQNNEP